MLPWTAVRNFSVGPSSGLLQPLLRRKLRCKINKFISGAHHQIVVVHVAVHLAALALLGKRQHVAPQRLQAALEIGVVLILHVSERCTPPGCRSTKAETSDSRTCPRSSSKPPLMRIALFILRVVATCRLPNWFSAAFELVNEVLGCQHVSP